MTEVGSAGQLELLRAATRGRKPKPPEPLAAVLPVARVVVDVPLPHLDRPFDYSVPESMTEVAQAGVRVRVRFAGQEVNGFILARAAETEHQGKLSPLRRVVSGERVLTPEVLRLARAVADRYAGSLNDVVRLAVPPRLAKVEQAAAPQAVEGPASSVEGSVEAAVGPPVPADYLVGRPGWEPYPVGAALLARLAAGESPRAVWTALPGAEWLVAIGSAIEATLRSGRGALVVLPDKRDVQRLDTELTRRLGPGRHARLEADLGPTARYRNFLAVSRGDVRVAIGTRAAAFAPVHRLGLAVIWQDGDDSHEEPRAPYPHAREVLALRAELEGAALIAGDWSQTVECAAWLRSGWARAVAADRATLRSSWPTISVATTEFGAQDDPAAGGRLPAPAWRALRDGLHHGPVLVQVPRAGYLPGLSCQSCRRPARCAHCHGPLGLPSAPLDPPAAPGPKRAGQGPASAPGPRSVAATASAPSRGADPHTSELSGASGGPQCRWCGRLAANWSCPHCQGHRLRATSVGVVRTADELGRAFPGAAIVVPKADAETPAVPEHGLVVSTPGLEPPVTGGYASAVLLDGWRLLERADLRASEDALSRWLSAAALVRSRPDGGRVVICADSAAPAVQALVRVDPAGHALRELDERAELGFPPATVMAGLTGPSTAVAALVDLTHLPAGTEILGPIPLPDRPGPPRERPDPSHKGPDPSRKRPGADRERSVEDQPEPPVQVLLRAPRAQAAALARAVHTAVATRSAKREPGAVRVRIDPADLV